MIGCAFSLSLTNKQLIHNAQYVLITEYTSYVETKICWINGDKYSISNIYIISRKQSKSNKTKQNDYHFTDIFSIFHSEFYLLTIRIWKEKLVIPNHTTNVLNQFVFISFSYIYTHIWKKTDQSDLFWSTNFELLEQQQQQQQKKTPFEKKWKKKPNKNHIIKEK